MTSTDGLTALPEDEAGLARYYGNAPDGVRANMVMTVDGQGAFHGRTKAISDPIDQKLLKHLRGHSDAVMIGSSTAVAEKYGPVRLSEDVRAQRQADGYADVPPLVIVTAHANLPLNLKIFAADGPRTIVATLAASAKQAGALHEVADVVAVGEDDIEVARVLAMLRDRGLARVLCEGGPFLLNQLVEADLIDDMCLTVSPFLAGNQPTTARPASEREAPTRLHLRHVLTHDDLLYLRYSR